MKEVNKVAHPLFIATLLLLIINDWYFKAAFHNEITGKLSDFAGLFAFPFLFSVLFPKHKMSIHLLTGLLFIFWNSSFSQTFINCLNDIGLPIARTIDITDNIALLSLIISYRCLSHQVDSQLSPLLRRALIAISCLAFIATTLPPRVNRKYVDINKEYPFDFSKRELVSRLNMVQVKEVHNINKYNRLIDFDAETNVFHYNGQVDTFALMLDYNQIKDQDTIEFKSAFAEIIITGNDSISQMELLTVYHITHPGILGDGSPYREKAVKQFEKRVVKKIEKYHN